MKRFGLAAIVVILAGFYFCSDPAGPDEPVRFIRQEMVADLFGDRNGRSSAAETDSMNVYFKVNEEAWFIGMIPVEYYASNEIPADTVFYYFTEWFPHGPNSNEKELRNSLGKTNFKSNAGIYVIRPVSVKRVQYFRIHRFLRAPGRNIGTAEWADLKLTE